MFDVSSSEFLLILAVAAVVIGPKDLPVVAKKIGKIIVKFKRASREFMRALEDVAEGTGIKEAIDEVNREGMKLNTIMDLEGNPREVYDLAEVERDVGVKKRMPKPVPKASPKKKKSDKRKGTKVKA